MSGAEVITLLNFSRQKMTLFPINFLELFFAQTAVGIPVL